MKILFSIVVCFIMLADVNLTTANCSGGVTYLSNNSTGTISSPNYPEDYDHDDECIWEIKTPGGGNIILEIEDIDIQQNVGCTSDYLLIKNAYDHDRTWGGGRRCGTVGATISGNRDSAYVIFHTDSSVSGEGFLLSWSESDIVAATTTTPTTAAAGSFSAKDTSGPGTTTQSPDINTIIAGSVVGAAFFIGLVTAVACIICRKNSACYYKKCGKSNDASKKPQSNRETSSLAFANEAKANSNRTPKGLTEKPMQKEESAMKQTKAMVKKVENLSQKAAPMDPKSNKSVDSSAQNKVAPAVAVKKQKKNTEQQDEPKSVLPHIMISYQWDVKEEVLEFRDMLKEAGYRVWIDVEQMHKHTSTFESMAMAVENSAIVIPVLTEQYQQSLNCRKEIEYADRRKVLLVPISMQSGFTPSSWLGFLLGHTRSYEMADPEKKEREAERLLSSLAELAKAAKEPEDEDEDNS